MITVGFSEIPETINIAKTKETPEALRQVAKEFESLLLTQITSALRVKPDDGDDQSVDSSSTDLSQQIIAEQMAEVIAKNGGIGLVDVLMQKLEVQKQELVTKENKLQDFIREGFNLSNEDKITRPRRVFDINSNEKINENITANKIKKLPTIKSLDSTLLLPNKVNSTKKLDQIILQASQRHGVDPHLIAAVIEQESGGKQFAISNKGAAGYMQLMPGTFKQFSESGKNIFDPEDNINAGVAYLKFLSDKYSGDMDKVLAGYNAGPGNVNKYNGIPPFAETRNFVEKVKNRHSELVANNELTNLVAKNVKQSEINPSRLINTANKNQVVLQNVVLKNSGSQLKESTSNSASLRLPVTGRISSNFGASRANRTHKGVDIAVNRGTAIEAAASGDVVFSGWQKGYGKTLLIQHKDGRLTRYAHAENLLVSKGDTVNVGQKIATVGSTGHSTGPHLHFEVIENGKAINPLVAVNTNNLSSNPINKPLVATSVENKKSENPLTLATIIPVVP